jgi:hypothetical protein
LKRFLAVNLNSSGGLSFLCLSYTHQKLYYFVKGEVVEDFMPFKMAKVLDEQEITSLAIPSS